MNFQIFTTALSTQGRALERLICIDINQRAFLLLASGWNLTMQGLAGRKREEIEARLIITLASSLQGCFT